jgi:hypothetical protein
MVELTASMVEVTQRVYDVLSDAKDELGIAAVYYGMQELIPEFPAISVESGRKQRQLAERSGGSTHKWAITFTVSLMVEHGKLQSSTTTRKETEQLAELIETKLHEDLKLGGLVIFGFVTSIDSGVTRRKDIMIRATRIIWEGVSRETF